MARARHAGQDERRRRRRTAAAAALVLAVAGGGTALALSRAGAPDDSATVASGAAPSSTAVSPAPPRTGTRGANASPGPSPSSPTASRVAPAPPPALVACARTVAAAEATVESVRTGADNWRAHVQAYRDLVDGRMPYPAAEAAWDRTERAAPGDVERFMPALRSYAAQRGACGDVVRAAGPGHAKTAQACAARGAMADAAVQSGREVMDAWAEHYAQMGQRRSGELSDDAADALFARAAVEAPQELSELARDSERLREAPACEVRGA